MSRRSAIAVLWSGGKDCYAALLLTCERLAVEPADVTFVTFMPPTGGFVCHPLGVMRRQVEALGASWRRISIDPADWRAEYDTALGELAADGIEEVVTGDQLDGQAAIRAHWLSAAATAAGMALHAPLAGLGTPRGRLELMETLGIEAVVTGVRDERDRALLGRRAGIAALASTGRLDDPGFDPCGERGEYHTIVTGHGGRRFLDLDPAALPVIRHGNIHALAFPPALLAR